MKDTEDGKVCSVKDAFLEVENFIKVEQKLRRSFKTVQHIL